MGRTDPPSAAAPAWPAALARGAVIAIGYFGLNWVAHALTSSRETYSLLWPGPGFALAALLIFGVRYWPAIALASVAYSLIAVGAPVFPLMLTGVMAVMVLASLVFLRRRRFEPPLTGVRRVIELLFVTAVLMPAVGAAFITTILWIAGQRAQNSLFEFAVVSVSTIGIGALVTAPIMLTWMRPPRPPWRSQRVIEAAALAAGTLLTGLLVFGGNPGRMGGVGIGYLAFPFIVWAAMRFGLIGSSTVSAAFSLIAMWGMAHGRGIFADATLISGMLSLNGFCVALTGTGLLIAAAVGEARRGSSALARSELAYRRLLEHASDPILLGDGAGNFLDANARATQMLGYSREELVRMHVMDLIPVEDRLKNPPRLEELRSGRSLTFERRLRCKDGRIIEVELSASMLEDGRIQAIYRDISDRKKTETELREAFSLLQATLDSTNDGILVVDTAGRISTWNRRFVELWGIPPGIMEARDDERAIGFVLDQLRNPEAFVAQVRWLYDHPEETTVDVLEFKDGRVYERYSQPQTVLGVASGRVWSFRDVTERRRLEGQLLHSQKMEAIGSLAGGVAHDFNNLLTSIMGHTSILLEGLPLDQPVRENAAEIQRVSERAALLTRQLLTFSRQQVSEPRVLDLNQVVLPMRQLLERSLGEQVEIALRPSAGPAFIKADAGELEQVVLNLSINARDAMPLGGRLGIEIATVRLDDSETAVQLPAGEYVRLTVSDTGIGMDAATKQRIFEPFFTTKARGRGTGLGLSTVYGIVHQGGGGIAVESVPANGTRFDLHFPRVATSSAPSAEAEAAVGAERGRGSVLLIEDDEMVRALLEEALAAAGYEVMVAQNGRDALERADSLLDRVDIVVTDVVMPNLSGPDVAERLRAIRPGLPVLFISGYTDDELATRVRPVSDSAFLQKPFSPATLIRKIRDTLGSAHSA
ncbi:MAG: PAS domain S-box protein [Candidatus Eisenbacteria bacterium]|nr:PAS domain S-box protein [Candidatus Eisenbacteria bacterium]